MVGPIRYMSLDDEPASHDVLRHLMQAHESFEDGGAFFNPVDALRQIEAVKPDLLFLDIEMPGLTGLGFLAQLKEPVATIMITAHADFALQGFELGVCDYLLKPVSKDRFDIAIDRVLPLVQHKRTESETELIPGDILAFQNGYESRFVRPDAIVFIDAEASFARLITSEGESIMVSHGLKELEHRLGPFGFKRIHKSHLVNCRKMDSLSGGFARSVCGLQRPIGRSYKKSLENLLV